MPRDRDVRAFDARAAQYEQGRLGGFHRDIAERTIELALSLQPTPHRVLDVGCGTGYLLRRAAERAPSIVEVIGVDPAPAMLRVARTNVADERVQIVAGVAEQLPFADGSIDLVISTTSFDHWSDQREGLSECRRVMTPEGHFVLVDLFSAALLPTLVGARRHKARTKRRLHALLASCGFVQPTWHGVAGRLIRAAVTAKDVPP